MKKAVVAAIGLIALAVSVATIADAVRSNSWGPIWAAGWLPAVLVASLYPAKGCARPFGRSRRP